MLYTCKKLGLFPSIFSVERKSYGDLYLYGLLGYYFDNQRTGKILFSLPFSIVVLQIQCRFNWYKNTYQKIQNFRQRKIFDGSLAFLSFHWH